MLKDDNKNFENIIKIKDIKIEELEKIKINYNEELENKYKYANEIKKEHDNLLILNDELNEEIQELKKKLEEYSNELDKLYSSNDINSQKMIKTIEEINKDKKGLEQKIIVLQKKKKN